MVDTGTELSKPELPSPTTVLETKFPFPFEKIVLWAESFNHLKFKEGESIKIEQTSESEDKKAVFQITLPKEITFEELIEVTREFIQMTGIQAEVDSLYLSQLRIFCRDLRNSDRVFAEIATSKQEGKPSLPLVDQKYKEEVLTFINSLYQLG